MSKTKKKMNTYVKYGLIMLGCVLGGGIFGALTSFFDVESASGIMGIVAEGVRAYMLPVMVVILILKILIGEILLWKMSKLSKGVLEADDEEGDKVEYELEKVGGIGNVVSVLVDVLAIAVLVNGYSMDYIASLEKDQLLSLLISMIIFIFIFVYSGLWSVRFVKKIQKIYPEKCGDPTSMKFQKQWLESCDEAEKEVIYQSSYKTYVFMCPFLQVLLFITMIGQLLWNTGILAVFVVGAVWLAMTCVYCRNCVKIQRSKINM